MSTKTVTAGIVKFNDTEVELGKVYSVDGRRAVPFMAWIRDDAEATYCGLFARPHTSIRFKFESGFGYKLEDFNTVYGKRVLIQELVA